MRVVRGTAALVVLLGGVIGVPWALVLLGGNPFPTRWDLTSVRRTLLRPDDGTVLIGLIALVAWAAWLVFSASVVAELVRALSRRHLEIRVPVLAGPQRLAAGLVLAVLALASGPAQAQADAMTPVSIAQPFDRGTVADHPDLRPQVAPAVGAPRADGSGTRPSGTHPPGTHGAGTHEPEVHHVVEAGDDLWTLAERFYGQGRAWRTIARANPDLLTGGPDRLQPGWRLVIPGADVSVSRLHVVRSGDTLSSIAADTYGDPEHWRELYLANRAQLADPDELAVGTRLTLPSRSEVERLDTVSTGDRTDAPSREEDGPTRTADDEANDERREGPPGGATPTPPADAPARPSPVPSERVLPSASSTASGVTADPTGTAQAPQPGPSPTPDDETISRAAAIVAGSASVGGLLAAGVIAGLALRRRTQRQLRPVGRRILAPPDPAEVLEASLGRRQRPVGRRTLDLALRALGAHCHHTGSPLPALEVVRLTDDRIVLEISFDEADGAASLTGGQRPERTSSPTPPAGFVVEGSSWVLRQEDVEDLMRVPGLGEASRPYPALVCVGRDDEGAQLLVDLESVGLMGVAGQAAATKAVLTALVAELAFSAWSDEMVLTVVESGAGLVTSLDQHNVSTAEDLDEVLNRLEARAAVQREHDPASVLGQRRVDPDLADPWVPEVLIVGRPVTTTQRARLDDILLRSPRVTMAAVITAAAPDTPWVLELGEPGGPVALRRPSGASIPVEPQAIDASAAWALEELVRSTSQGDTESAPWWDSGESPPPPNVRYVERWGEGAEQSWVGEGADMTQASDSGIRHPTLLLLGPVELVGATGTLPPRAAGQCLEYCAWLLHRRETTARAMAAGLAVAEGTRRSNMSRLRTWLGHDENGQPYLPDAYSGHIVLHPHVDSDWHQLQMLTGPGVNLTTSSALHAALTLVRGAPLADAAPGQWHWAEEMRTDMISVVRDVGVELAARALAARDIDLARWAAARALSVAPGDELLIRARIRTEHQAGNEAEVERLILQLASQARSLGIDLDPETVRLLQEMMEGQVRARLA